MSDEDKALWEWWHDSGHAPGNLERGLQECPETIAFRAGWAAGVAAVKVAKILPATVRPAYPITDEG